MASHFDNQFILSGFQLHIGSLNLSPHLYNFEWRTLFFKPTLAAQTLCDELRIVYDTKIELGGFIMFEQGGFYGKWRIREHRFMNEMLAIRVEAVIARGNSFPQNFQLIFLGE